MSLEELYGKILQQNSNGLEEKVKKASFYLDGRIDDIENSFKILLEKAKEKIQKKSLPYYKTEMITKDNITVKNREMLMDFEGKGILNQFFCKSNSNNFNVFILIDNKIIFEKPYKYFQDLSKHLEDIEAYQKDDNFFLDMKNFGFLKSVRIYLTSETQTIFNSIVIKYLIYEEKSLLFPSVLGT